VRRGGFTLIELIVVVALIAVAAGLISLSLRDPAATRLEHEAARLSALLESARAESRASGLGVHWVPRGLVAGEDFHFVGLGPQSDMPKPLRRASGRPCPPRRAAPARRPQLLALWP
jgi:general secretion pathway protein H